MPASVIAIEFFALLACLGVAATVLVRAGIRGHRQRSLFERVKDLRVEVKKAAIQVTSSTSDALTTSLGAIGNAAKTVYGMMPRPATLLAETLHLIRKAEALMGQGTSPEARQLLVQALSSDPDNVRALKSLARLYEGEGQTAQAEQLLLRVIELGAADAETYEGLGRILLGEGRAAPAVSALERAIELQPRRSALYALLSEAARAAGRFDVVRTATEQAYRLEPKKHELLLPIADAYRELGEIGKARTALQRYLHHKPYDEGAKRMLADMDALPPAPTEESTPSQS